MFQNFINLCFSGLSTDMERLFAIVLVLSLISVFEEIMVALVEVGKR